MKHVALPIALACFLITVPAAAEEVRSFPNDQIATGAELEGAFKPSSLRSIAKTSPYMHAGHFASLQEVLEHYNRAPAAPVGDTELKPLNLSVTELAHLEAFLRGLSGPHKTAPELR